MPEAAVLHNEYVQLERGVVAHVQLTHVENPSFCGFLGEIKPPLNKQESKQLEMVGGGTLQRNSDSTTFMIKDEFVPRLFAYKESVRHSDFDIGQRVLRIVFRGQTIDDPA